MISKIIDSGKPVASSEVALNPDFYKPAVYDAHESAGYLMRRVVAALAQSVERELESSGLTNAQWLPLFKLSKGSTATVAELARECELDAGSMTRLLDRIEAKGLCKRVRSSVDRRVVNLELTEEGRIAAQKIPAVLCQVQNQHLAGFTPSEWLLLKSFLHRILDNASALQDTTSPSKK